MILKLKWTNSIPDNHFRALYRDVLKNLAESKKVLLTEVYVGTTQEVADQNAVRVNKIALIDIYSAYSYSILVDTFGESNWLILSQLYNFAVLLS